MPPEETKTPKDDEVISTEPQTENPPEPVPVTAPDSTNSPQAVSEPAQVTPPPEANPSIGGEPPAVEPEPVIQAETPVSTEAPASVPVPSEPTQELPAPVQPPPQPQQTPLTPQQNPIPTTSVLHGDIVKARAKIQETKRKKLDKIMETLEEKGPASFTLRRAGAITNDEVEKLLHVSDSTATRYLDILEKEGKIRQVGKTGRGVVYVKI